MDADIRKLLYPSRIYYFSECQLYTQRKALTHLLAGYHGDVFLGKKDKIRSKILH